MAEPVIGLLHLVAVLDSLFENAIFVAQTIADGGELKVAIESRKQAASRPRPPLPRPASGSISASSAESSPSRCRAFWTSGSTRRLMMLLASYRPMRNSIDR